jgi:hypothetical protein
VGHSLIGVKRDPSRHSGVVDEVVGLDRSTKPAVKPTSSW